MEEMNERLEAITKLEGLVKSGDEANLKLAYQLNKGQNLMTDSELVLIQNDPIKNKMVEVMKLLGSQKITGVCNSSDFATYRSNQAKDTDEEVYEYILTREFKDGFSFYLKNHFIKDMGYWLNKNTTITLNPITFATSSPFLNPKWTTEALADFIAKLEAILSPVIELEPENKEIDEYIF
jgi:hypothetical protein